MKLTALILSIIISVTMLVSCSESSYDPLAEKNIVESEIHKEFDLTSNFVDAYTFEAVNEFSTQVIKCKVTDIAYLTATVFNTISFKFNVEIEEIYLDVNDRINVGDKIIVSSNNGIIKASEAEKLLMNSEGSKKYSILQDGPYGENDYVVYSMFDGIPMEVGNSYILYLTDLSIDYGGNYADIGYSHVYAITDSGIYQGADITKLDMNERELEKFVKNGVKERSGRLEKVGRKQLRSELAEKQRKEREELAKESDSLE